MLLGYRYMVVESFSQISLPSSPTSEPEAMKSTLHIAGLSTVGISLPMHTRARVQFVPKIQILIRISCLRYVLRLHFACCYHQLVIESDQALGPVSARQKPRQTIHVTDECCVLTATLQAHCSKWRTEDEDGVLLSDTAQTVLRVEREKDRHPLCQV